MDLTDLALRSGRTDRTALTNLESRLVRTVVSRFRLAGAGSPMLERVAARARSFSLAPTPEHVNHRRPIMRHEGLLLRAPPRQVLTVRGRQLPSLLHDRAVLLRVQ